MYVITAQNVNDAYASGLTLLAAEGRAALQPSRNGRVLTLGQPVTTHYRYPWQRVLFNSQRDANPFFHLFEGLWMLSGADDVALPAYFTPRIAAYSDDGTTLHGAYGARWYELDQLNTIINELRDDPQSRRAVIAMWMPERDLHLVGGKDVPCNVMIKFAAAPHQTRTLNMTVFNRSNDAIFGAYGANAVHFSMLQEYVALALGWRIGWYEQVSADLHVYMDPHPGQRTCWDTCWPMHATRVWDPYSSHVDSQRVVSHALYPNMQQGRAQFDENVRRMLDEIRTVRFVAEQYHTTPFLARVAQPMANAFAYYKIGEIQRAFDTLGIADLNTSGAASSVHYDWLVAGIQWLNRRVKTRTHNSAQPISGTNS